MCLDHALNWMEHMRIAFAGRIEAIPADAPRTRPAHRARLGARAAAAPGRVRDADAGYVARNRLENW